jgi:hypothetical protein
VECLCGIQHFGAHGKFDFKPSMLNSKERSGKPSPEGRAAFILKTLPDK